VRGRPGNWPFYRDGIIWETHEEFPAQHGFDADSSGGLFSQPCGFFNSYRHS
jgi:hypothetical protein